MDTILGIIAFVLILGAIILVHEGGHFFFAVKGGILCREYAFGMGPILWKKKKGEVLYSIRAFPIGGFCAICGEEGEEDPLKDLKKIRLEVVDGIVTKIYLPTDGKKKVNLFDDKKEYTLVSYDLYDKDDTGKLFIEVEKEVKEDGIIVTETLTVAKDACYVFGVGKHDNEEVPLEKRLLKNVQEFQIGPHNRTLNSKSFGRKFMVIFGGPMMNFLLAILAFFISIVITGTANTSNSIVGEFSESDATYSPLYIAGVEEGDEIKQLTYGTLTVAVNEWNDISSFMDQYSELENKGDITVSYIDKSENNELKTVNVTPMVYIYSISMIQDYSVKDKVAIGELNEKSKAYESGLRQGDIIKEIIINDTTYTINSWFDVYDAYTIPTDGKTEVIVKVEREGELLSDEFKMTPYSKELFDKTQNVPIVDLKIGVSCATTRNIFKVVKATFVQMWASIVQLFNTLGMLIFSSAVGIKDLSGPVGIFSMTKTAVSGGIGYLFYWLGFLSVNVGFMNLLPIPALDGGRILFMVIEKIRRKPLSQKVQDLCINITYYALLALIVYVTINDVLRLIK